MSQSNKKRSLMDRSWTRVARYLREWRARHAPTIHDHFLHGVSYGAGSVVGSGAVSLLVIWYETRS